MVPPPDSTRPSSDELRCVKSQHTEDRPGKSGQTEKQRAVTNYKEALGKCAT
jgi:hypothetical protein